MGFFERISRSPAEKKYAAFQRQNYQDARRRLPQALDELPMAIESAKQAFAAAHTNNEWRKAANAAKLLRDTAKDAQSVPAFAMGAELHAKSYMREVIERWRTNPAAFTFQNLSGVWYELVEDLGAIDIGTREGGTDPDSLSDVIGLITELEKLMLESFGHDPKYEDWKRARVYSRQRTPVIPPLSE